MHTPTDQPAIVRDLIAAGGDGANALTRLGYKADFSLECLREVDRFFDDNSADGEPIPGGQLADDTGGRLFMIGGYVGEVLRRNIGGEWVGDDSDPKAEINAAIEFASGGLVWPIQRVMKRLSLGSEESIYVYGRRLLETASGR